MGSQQSQLYRQRKVHHVKAILTVQTDESVKVELMAEDLLYRLRNIQSARDNDDSVIPPNPTNMPVSEDPRASKSVYARILPNSDKFNPVSLVMMTPKCLEDVLQDRSQHIEPSGDNARPAYETAASFAYSFADHK